MANSLSTGFSPAQLAHRRLTAVLSQTDKRSICAGCDVVAFTDAIVFYQACDGIASVVVRSGDRTVVGLIKGPSGVRVIDGELGNLDDLGHPVDLARAGPMIPPLCDMGLALALFGYVGAPGSRHSDPDTLVRGEGQVRVVASWCDDRKVALMATRRGHLVYASSLAVSRGAWSVRTAHRTKGVWLGDIAAQLPNPTTVSLKHLELWRPVTSRAQGRRHGS